MSDLTKPERRKDPTSQLLRAIQEQNAMLEQILSFIEPIASFFKALKLVVKVSAFLLAIGAAIYKSWDWIVFQAKH